MNKNEIWEEIKNDKTMIYGQSILDVFLQTTEELEFQHYLTLDDKQKEYVYKNSLILKNLLSGAIQQNQLDIIKFLINKGAKNLGNAVLVASKYAKWDAAKLIIDIAIEQNSKSLNLNNALSSIIHSKYIQDHRHLENLEFVIEPEQEELIDYIISKGASLDVALENAMEMQNLGAIKFLINKGADLEQGLINAATNHETKIVEFLINKGAKNLDQALRKTLWRFHKQSTRIHRYPDFVMIARDNAMKECKAIIKLLLDKGADIEQALWWAVESGSLFLVEFLINKGAKNLDRALRIAEQPSVYTANPEIAEFLKEKISKQNSI
jgi:ankyrin repeat protein